MILKQILMLILVLGVFNICNVSAGVVSEQLDFKRIEMWEVCKVDSDCISVLAGNCDYWQPINKKFAIDFGKSGFSPKACDSSLAPWTKPKVSCVNKSCVGNSIK